MAQSAEARESMKLTAAVARGLRESAAIAIAVVALVMLVALATYSPSYSAFSLASDSTSVANRTVTTCSPTWSSAAAARCVVPPNPVAAQNRR